ncbi:hypothetical protein, partial [Staphylococcus aureus]|uniref:hypothetical protein n=1 Tax=Staphylococcus aureus TaxID=1280 RepID=UPI00197ED7CA
SINFLGINACSFFVYSVDLVDPIIIASSFLFYISKGALTYQNGIVLNSKIRVIFQYTYLKVYL